MFGKQGIGLAIGKGLNGVMGFLLGIALAHVFGVSHKVDALFLALFVAVAMGGTLRYVVKAAVLPCLVEAAERGDQGLFLDVFNTAVLAVSVLIPIVLGVGSPLIVRVFSPGLDPETTQHAVFLLRILAPCAGLAALLGAQAGFCHARRHFALPEAGQFAWRLLAIIGLFTLGRRYGVEGYALGLAVASLIEWAGLSILCRMQGYRLVPLTWRNLPFGLLRPFAVGALAVVVTVCFSYVEQIADRMVLSFLPTGALAQFAYASRLAFLVPSLLSISFFIPLAPDLSRIRMRHGNLRHPARQASLFLAALGIPIGVALFRVAGDLVDLLLVHGKFDQASGVNVAGALRAFAVSIPAMFCVRGLRGSYVVERNVRDLVWSGCFGVGVHAAALLGLVRFGVPGIAAAGAVTIWVLAIRLWIRNRCPERTVFDWPRFAAALLVMGGLLFGLPWDWLVPWSVPRMLLGPACGGLAYFAIMRPALRAQNDYLSAMATDEGSKGGETCDRL